VKWTIVLMALLAAAGCRQATTEAAQRPAPKPAAGTGRVRFAPGSPQLEQIRSAALQEAVVEEDRVAAPGKVDVNPNRVARVALPLPGRIKEMRVRLGDMVQAGATLLTLESSEAEAVMSECLNAEAAQARSRAALTKSQSDRDRIADLLEKGAAARKELVNAEAELAQVQAELKGAQASLEQARRRSRILGLRPCEFGQALEIKAPIAGKVLELTAAPGEFRNDTSATLLMIADLSTVWVVSDVPESSIRLVTPGEQVEIELSAYPGEKFHGRVLHVADQVNPETRTVQVRMELANPAGRFRPEMFARIVHAHGSRVLPVAPETAVVRTAAGSFLYLERGPGEFERVRVETGEPRDGRVPLLSGAETGQRVVIAGAVLLEQAAGSAR
jgi:cobalt-zinc-cadmium efflux system membrane fusion protein